MPPNKNVSVLLKEMREKRIHLALVRDEYGGTDGLVTMEDLIEEIVGDIRDEQEKELREIEEIAANRYIVDGKTDIGQSERAARRDASRGRIRDRRRFRARPLREAAGGRRPDTV